MESSVSSQGSNNGQNSKSCEPDEAQGFEGNLGANLSLTKNTLCEPQNILKKQEVRPQNLTSVQCGWGGRIRTYECRHQKPMPYHLATPQQ